MKMDGFLAVGAASTVVTAPLVEILAGKVVLEEVVRVLRPTTPPATKFS